MSQSSSFAKYFLVEGLLEWREIPGGRDVRKMYSFNGCTMSLPLYKIKKSVAAILDSYTGLIRPGGGNKKLIYVRTQNQG